MSKPPADPGHVIEYRDPRSLTPDPNNARTHPQSQLDEIKAGFRRFGFTNPVLLKPSGMIGAGHGRQEAAIQMIAAGEPIKRTPDGVSIPTIVLHGLSEDEWRAYAIADNKIAANAGWDEDMLRRELGDLKSLGFDLALTGFSTDEVGTLFAPPPSTRDPERTPEAPVRPVSVLGDLWRLGPHLIICGSSTDQETVTRVLDGFKPHLMVTDPPYGVDYDPTWRGKALGEGKRGRATGLVMNDGQADWREAWALFPGDVAYVWHSGTKADIVAASLHATSFEIRAQIIWNKANMVIGRGHYHPKHEPCWYAVRKGGTGHWQGSRKETTVWDIEHRKSETGHGTQKPLEAMARPIRNNSAKGDRIYEPFSGSGTTIMAAHLNGRICHAIELDPKYVDVAVTRWSEYTGEAAVHADTGQSFADVKAERHAA